MVSTCPPNSRLPKISGLAIPERKRKVAIKCLELEEMLERQGHSQSEIESKVASFRALLLRQITSCNQSVNNNSKSSPGRPEPDSTTPVQETTTKPKERSLSRHRDDREEEKRPHKKRKRKKEESKPRKKKKKEKRKVHYCSSPSYSDFEPEDPILRRRLRAKKDQKRIVAENVGQDKAWSSSKKEKKKKKRRRRSRSESKKSSSRSRSRSKLRKSRSIERQPKGKRRKGRSCSRLNEKVDPKICQNEEESDPQKPKEDHSKLATSNVRQNGSDSRIGNESAGKEAKEVLDEEKNGNAEESRRKKDESGGIIVTKIDDIPTKPEWFERQTLTSRAFREVKLVEPKKVDHNSSKLKFEFNFPAKRLALKANPAAPTFAELSNKLGPTQSLSGRRLPALSQASTKAAPEPAKPTISQQKVMAKNAAEPEEQDVSENLPDIVHIKDVNGNKSKGRENSRSRSRSWSGSEGGRGGGRSRSESRSYTYSRSRSRSRSYTYSRSRSRSYSYSSYYSRSRSRSQSFYSRSRSRSYYSSYSSRSRSRTRSPSIVRRRGSPSFLDKRRITSARKRPVPYHRPTPSPSPSSSSSRASTRSPSPSRSHSRSKKRAGSRK